MAMPHPAEARQAVCLYTWQPFAQSEPLWGESAFERFMDTSPKRHRAGVSAAAWRNAPKD